jgi:hypothetical protein
MKELIAFVFVGLTVKLVALSFILEIMGGRY